MGGWGTTYIHTYFILFGVLYIVHQQGTWPPLSEFSGSGPAKYQVFIVDQFFMTHNHERVNFWLRKTKFSSKLWKV